MMIILLKTLYDDDNSQNCISLCKANKRSIYLSITHLTLAAERVSHPAGGAARLAVYAPPLLVLPAGQGGRGDRVGHDGGRGEGRAGGPLSNRGRRDLTRHFGVIAAWL